MATSYDQIFPSFLSCWYGDSQSTLHQMLTRLSTPVHQHQCLCSWFTLEAPHPQTTTPGLSLPRQKFHFRSRENANSNSNSFKLFLRTELEHNGSLWFSQKKQKTKQKIVADSFCSASSWSWPRQNLSHYIHFHSSGSLKSHHHPISGQ